MFAKRFGWLFFFCRCSIRRVIHLKRGINHAYTKRLIIFLFRIAEIIPNQIAIDCRLVFGFVLLIFERIEAMRKFRHSPFSNKVNTLIAKRILKSTYIVPLATVILRFMSTGFGFDLLPKCLNACRTDTASLCRLCNVPPSSIIDIFVSLPLRENKSKKKKRKKVFSFNFVFLFQKHVNHLTIYYH